MSLHLPAIIWIFFRSIVFLLAFGRFYKEEEYGTIAALVCFNLFEVGLLELGGFFK
jgi:hypothetical protein